MTNNQAPGHLSPSLPRLYRPGRYPRITPRESRERPSATERLAKLREISRAIVSSDSSLAFRHNELRGFKNAFRSTAVCKETDV